VPKSHLLLMVLRRKDERPAVGVELDFPVHVRRLVSPSGLGRLRNKLDAWFGRRSLVKQVSSPNDLVLDVDRPFGSTDGAPKVRTRTAG
jgi:hypothetical protein